jgi:hypothetical protein
MTIPAVLLPNAIHPSFHIPNGYLRVCATPAQVIHASMLLPTLVSAAIGLNFSYQLEKHDA